MLSAGIANCQAAPSVGGRAGGRIFDGSRNRCREAGMARRSGVEVRRPSAVIRAEAANGEAAGTAMSREQLVEFYRLMYLSRRTDDREIVLKRQQKIFFQISCRSEERRVGEEGESRGW